MCKKHTHKKQPLPHKNMHVYSAGVGREAYSFTPKHCKKHTELSMHTHTHTHTHTHVESHMCAHTHTHLPIVSSCHCQPSNFCRCPVIFNSSFQTVAYNTTARWQCHLKIFSSNTRSLPDTSDPGKSAATTTQPTLSTASYATRRDASQFQSAKQTNSKTFFWVMLGQQ